MSEFGGTWKEGNPVTKTKAGLWKDYQQTLTFTLPALGASIWRLKRRLGKRKEKDEKNAERNDL